MVVVVIEVHKVKLIKMMTATTNKHAAASRVRMCVNPPGVCIVQSKLIHRLTGI